MSMLYFFLYIESFGSVSGSNLGFLIFNIFWYSWNFIFVEYIFEGLGRMLKVQIFPSYCICYINYGSHQSYYILRQLSNLTIKWFPIEGVLANIESWVGTLFTRSFFNDLIVCTLLRLKKLFINNNF